jgi:tetratricopeptide (TPR) repeat protein/tRNA A-37 threonylcarbamoyl transferase component Bud32
VNDSTLVSLSDLPPDRARAVDRVCGRFEAAWQGGSRPSLEAFLADAPAELSAVLLRELVLLDLQYRRRAGDQPGAQDYRERFPHLDASWLTTALAEGSAGPASATVTALDPPPATATGPGSQAPDALPRSCGDYELLCEIGRGGMGVVYKARQKRLDRLVALKMIRSADLAGPEELVRFRAEAEAVAQLQHPHIVQIHEVGESNGTPFFSLEYVEGGNLAQRVNGIPLPARQAARLVETLARTIHFAHQRGIIHRDLKPHNVLLARSDRPEAIPLGSPSDAAGPYEPKVGDFGLAKRLNSAPGQTQSGAIMGTPSYMAPEQATGKTRDIGPAADVYALGAILYDLLTGRPPFQAETTLDTLAQVVHQEPVPPSRLVPRVPRDLETITLKCLQKAAGRRYASAEALADDLRRFQAGEPIRARPVGRLERLGKWARRRPAAAAAVALGVVLGVVGVLWYSSELRAENRQLRAEIRAQQRLEDQRTRVHGLLHTARAEFDNARSQPDARARSLGSAHEKLEQARTILGSEPSLADLRTQVGRLLTRTEAWQQDLEARERSRRLGDQALFFSTQVNGPGGPAGVKKVRELARAALAALGWTGRSTLPLLNHPHFNKSERAAITRHCYGLLLLLAEVEARPLPREDRLRQAGQALHFLDQAARLGVRTRAYYLRRARYLEQRGDAAGAALAGRRANRLPAAAAGAVDLFLLGQDCLQRQQFTRAIDYFEQSLSREPGHFGAELLMSICYLQRRRPVEAVFCLRHCATLRPDFVMCHLLSGFAHGMLGRQRLDERGLTRRQRREQADAHFQMAEKHFQKAESLKRGVDEDHLLHVHRGVLRIYQGRYPDAVADLRRAIRLRSDQYQAYLNLARACELQGDVSRAIRELTTAIGLAQGQAALYRTRAQLFLQRKPPDRQAALRDLGLAIRNEPAGSNVAEVANDHKQRGILRELEGNYAAAVQEFDAALRLRPDFTVVLLLRAEALGKLGRAQDQVQSLDEYLKRLTWLVDGRRGERQTVADVYRHRARARARLHDYRGALGDATRALDLEPKASTYAFRGWLYLTHQAPELALGDFTEAIRLEPGNADAHAGRGYARVRLNQPRRAVADAAEALRLGPREAGLLYKIVRVYAQASAMVLIKLGRGNREALSLSAGYQDRALELLRQALEQYTTTRERRQFWESYVKADPALRPVRQTPRYDRLARKYTGPAR